jgi:hypothetical protein
MTDKSIRNVFESGDERRQFVDVPAMLVAPYLRVRSFADFAAVSGLLAFVTVLIAVTWRAWGDFGGDTGYDLLAASRLVGGELPYRDFTYYYGPLAPALLGLAFWIGPAGIGSAIALGLVLGVGATLMTYALARSSGLDPLEAFLVGAITAPVVFGPHAYNFVLPHTFSAPTGICAALGFLFAVGRYGAAGRNRWMVVAGVCAGLTTLTRPELAAGTFGAAVIWLALRAWRGIGGWREAAVFSAPALLIPVATYGALSTVVSPYRLVFENLYPVRTLQAAGNAVLRSNAPLTLQSFVDIGWRSLLYLAGVLVMLAVAYALARPGFLGRVALVAGVGSGLLAGAILVGRPETVRYYLTHAYGWIPVGVVLAVPLLVWRGALHPRSWSASAQVELTATIILAVFAVKTYAIFFIYSHVPQIAAYVVPLAALFLARLHLAELPRAAHALGVAWLAFLAIAGSGLTLKDAWSKSDTVSGPGGYLHVRPRDTAVYQGAVASIIANTERKESILVGPQLTILYVLTDRRNPLPQLSLLPGALPTLSDEREAIARLEAAHVRLAVLDRHDFADYGHTVFGESFQRELASRIHQDFGRLATLSGSAVGSPTIDVWLRNVSTR